MINSIIHLENKLSKYGEVTFIQQRISANETDATICINKPHIVKLYKVNEDIIS